MSYQPYFQNEVDAVMALCVRIGTAVDRSRYQPSMSDMRPSDVAAIHVLLLQAAEICRKANS